MTILNKIRENIEKFKLDVLELERFLTGTRISYQFFKDNFQDIRNEFTKKTRNDEEIEGMHSFETLNRSISKFDQYLAKNCFISLIARTEAFLNDIGRTIYLWKNPEIEKKEYESKIQKYSHMPFKQKIKQLTNECGLKFEEIENKEADIMEVFGRRNIIMHNNGIVNKTYLRLNQNSRLKEGDEIIIEEAYLKIVFLLIVIIAKSIEAGIIENNIGDA